MNKKENVFAFVLAFLVILPVVGYTAYAWFQTSNRLDTVSSETSAEQVRKIQFNAPGDWRSTIVTFNQAEDVLEREDLLSVEVWYPEYVKVNELSVDQSSVQLEKAADTSIQDVPEEAISIKISFLERKNPNEPLQSELIAALIAEDVEVISSVEYVEVNGQEALSYVTNGVWTYTHYAFETSNPAVYLAITSANQSQGSHQQGRLTQNIIGTILLE